jgi:hypothetical protein
MGNALIPHVDSAISRIDALFRVNHCPPYSDTVIARPIDYIYLVNRRELWRAQRSEHARGSPSARFILRTI